MRIGGGAPFERRWDQDAGEMVYQISDRVAEVIRDVVG